MDAGHYSLCANAFVETLYRLKYLSTPWISVLSVFVFLIVSTGDETSPYFGKKLGPPMFHFLQWKQKCCENVTIIKSFVVMNTATLWRLTYYYIHISFNDGDTVWGMCHRVSLSCKHDSAHKPKWYFPLHIWVTWWRLLYRGCEPFQLGICGGLKENELPLPGCIGFFF